MRSIRVQGRGPDRACTRESAPSMIVGSFCGFLRLQIRVEGPSTGPAKDHRPMSPWQAERLFSTSPHLTSYVQRLWIDIPPPTQPGSAPPADWRYTDLPEEALKYFPSLFGVEIEEAAPQSALPKQAYHSRRTSRAAGAINHISRGLGSHRQDHEGVTATLTHLTLRVNPRVHSTALIHLNALHVLRLELAVDAWPYRLSGVFAALLSQMLSVIPHLEQLIIRLTVSTQLRSDDPLCSSIEQDAETAWAHSGPLDLGQLGAVHCQLCFQDYPLDPSEARRELRATVYYNFVQCMGEQMPVLRDNGGLSFSQIWIR
ncbi:hypothetical protein B0H19DRAFT_1061526 [Mycena capillaripes]|nr:hypothetical protein B0H19DRAFT_1061526 [Mycena capillaripes]